MQVRGEERSNFWNAKYERREKAGEKTDEFKKEKLLLTSESRLMDLEDACLW